MMTSIRLRDNKCFIFFMNNVEKLPKKKKKLFHESQILNLNLKKNSEGSAKT